MSMSRRTFGEYRSRVHEARARRDRGAPWSLLYVLRAVPEGLECGERWGVWYPYLRDVLGDVSYVSISRAEMLGYPCSDRELWGVTEWERDVWAPPSGVLSMLGCAFNVAPEQLVRDLGELEHVELHERWVSYWDCDDLKAHWTVMGKGSTSEGSTSAGWCYVWSENRHRREAGKMWGQWSPEGEVKRDVSWHRREEDACAGVGLDYTEWRRATA